MDTTKFGHRYRNMREGCEPVQIISVEKNCVTWIFVSNDQQNVKGKWKSKHSDGN